MLKSLMSLLLSLFYSKKDSELVANQSMPGEEKINISSTDAPNSWETVATYTAPCPGTASLRGLATKDTTFVQIWTGGTPVDHPSLTTFSSTAQNPQIAISVKKGELITFKANGLRNVQAFFNKAIGGGYLVTFKGVQYA